MPSRLSIFSSRILGSALVWAIVLIVAIEWRQARALPGRYFSHEVDHLLYDLDRGLIPTNSTLFLGDSVGRQIAGAILARHPESFATLACNAAIQTAGQYYLLCRYLERHPPPRRVILMMGSPLDGDLRTRFTENYVQRCFLRWHEIGELAWERRSLSFGLVMTGYKLFPTLRYRLHLQKTVPGLVTPDPYIGWINVAAKPGEVKAAPDHGLIEGADRLLKRRQAGRTIAENYFQRICRRLEQQGVELVFLPVPVPRSAEKIYAPGAWHRRQIETIRGMQAQYDNLRLSEDAQLYPNDWFRDGTHFKPEREAQVAADYEQRLAGLGIRIGGEP